MVFAQPLTFNIHGDEVLRKIIMKRGTRLIRNLELEIFETVTLLDR